MTETCGISAVQTQLADDWQHGSQGVVIPSLQVKLVSCPSMKDVAGQPFLSSDRFDMVGNPILGRGEFCVKGDNVSVGYYRMPEATQQVFDADGWFHTGHLGRFLPNGSISILFRKRDLVKLKGGDYIVLDMMD